jgi:hypothetical protein
MTTEIVQFKCQGSKDGYCIVKLKQEQELLENHREEIEFLAVFYQEQNRMNKETWKERFKELESNMSALDITQR